VEKDVSGDIKSRCIKNKINRGNNNQVPYRWIKVPVQDDEESEITNPQQNMVGFIPV
jgi:hypothetical protein